MNNKLSVVALFLIVATAAGRTEAANFSSVYAFGDSLSDSGKSASSVWSIYNFLNGYPGPINPNGNCDATHPCPPYFEGRISNGPTTVERIANSILPGGSNSSNFFNYAVAGATSGIGNFGDGGSQSAPGGFLLPGIAQQIGFYLNNAVPTANALHFVWGGANDYLTDVYIPLATQPGLDPSAVAKNAAQTAATNIASYVGALADFGAETILVPNLPDLGLTPFVASQGQGVIDPAREYSLTFNQTLASLLGLVDNKFAATDIVEFDSFGLFNAIVANPSGFGFGDAVSACVSLPDACADPNNHVFWDDFHPTAAMHTLVADAMVSQVPLPAAVWLFAAGLFALCRRPRFTAPAQCNPL
ncbi:SGNH/GDSL hydrolase family protein [Methylomonas sp. SURF-1]|uniref:SGNH/GDSL hydrolase family protein n=1 Tax=Methylomonas aurea TaxID=2952224 RepID=A0ABT1UFT7_9GAMM|nr:SGNH/GDSL hydrolase family protein [Methylomonas sp. SURF-1]MCQ8181095.1 SGNH/GDSL hydrolase family protein [Methylomonas sp. SURF-1]